MIEVVSENSNLVTERIRSLWMESQSADCMSTFEQKARRVFARVAKRTCDDDLFRLRIRQSPVLQLLFAFWADDLSLNAS